MFAVGTTPLGSIRGVTHRIDVNGARPINRPPYRLSPWEEEIAAAEIKKMLESGVIRESQSPWAAPVVLVKKKDGSVRFCVDYRRLNAVTVRDVYPIPRIDDTLDALATARWFTVLDAKSGYWQVEVAEEDKQKTAFSTRSGLFEFNKMPFGLTNAPATFQ